MISQDINCHVNLCGVFQMSILGWQQWNWVDDTLTRRYKITVNFLSFFVVVSLFWGYTLRNIIIIMRRRIIKAPLCCEERKFRFIRLLVVASFGKSALVKTLTNFLFKKHDKVRLRTRKTTQKNRTFLGRRLQN